MNRKGRGKRRAIEQGQEGEGGPREEGSERG